MARQLEPVPDADVLDAIRRAGRCNPMLGIGIGIGAEVSWAGAPIESVSAARLIDSVEAWSGARERRIAASLVTLGYSARLLGPVTAVWMREGILLDVRPENVAHRFDPASGLRLALKRGGGWRGSAELLTDQLHRQVIDTHLRMVVDAVNAVVPVARGLLWGNVASSLAGALAAVVREGAASAPRCLDAGQPLLRRPPLAGSGQLSVARDRLEFRRRSCCLYYRLEGGGTCGDCPFTKPPGRLPG